MDFVSKIVEFNEVAGNENEFDARKVALYIGLVLEEAQELIDALPHSAQIEGLGKLSTALDYYSRRFKGGEFDKDVNRINRVEALDAFVDIGVVTLGGAHALGADVNGACHEVMDSNLSKFPIIDGKRTVIKDENGKVKKPEGYRAPELEQFL